MRSNESGSEALVYAAVNGSLALLAYALYRACKMNAQAMQNNGPGVVVANPVGAAFFIALPEEPAEAHQPPQQEMPPRDPQATGLSSSQV
ncbi:MAG: hypothetical protein P1U63_06690 [Coxiellaceae bacterium]|nr:hypothetical protein [Coxiellaceae bacterium]